MDWRSDLQTGLEEALLTRRPMMVNFYTTWCGWCRKLDGRTFRDPGFIEASRAVVPIKVDGDRERGLAAMFRVNGYPTTVFLSRRGKEIGRVVGYQPPDAFTRELETAIANREPDLEAVARRAGADPEDPENLYALADVYLALGRYEEAASALDRVEELDPDNQSGLADDARMDLAICGYLAGEPARSSIAKFEQFLKEYPRSDRRDVALFYYGAVLIDSGKRSEGEALIAEAAEITRIGYIKEEADRLARPTEP